MAAMSCFPSGTYSGNGLGSDELNASSLSSGTVPDARMPGMPVLGQNESNYVYGTVISLPGTGSGTVLSNSGSAMQWVASPSGGGGGSWSGTITTGITNSGANGIINAGPMTNLGKHGHSGW